MLCYDVSCYVIMLCYVMLSYDVSCRIVLYVCLYVRMNVCLYEWMDVRQKLR